MLCDLLFPILSGEHYLVFKPLLVAAAVGGFRIWQQPDHRARKHRTKIKKALRVLDQLHAIKEPFKQAKQLTYLRKIDPYVFEELLLSLYHRQGIQIIRNKRYSKDGGFDGQIHLADGALVLIQAKRYSGYIARVHLEEFASLVKTHKAAYGYFMHTGRTSRHLLEEFRRSNVIIYSGEKLLDLLE